MLLLGFRCSLFGRGAVLTALLLLNWRQFDILCLLRLRLADLVVGGPEQRVPVLLHLLLFQAFVLWVAVLFGDGGFLFDV